MKKYLFDILYYLQILRLFPMFYFHYELRKYIKKGDVVIDIGANWGIYTRLFSRWGAEVFAIEPIIKFYNNLKRIKNVRVAPYALGDEQRMVRMEQWRDSSGAYKVSDKGQLWANMIQGSQHFKRLPKINFIKIDVEGSELPIIKDMKELILKHKPMILVETGQIDEVLELLNYEIKEQCLNDYLICPKKQL